MSFLRSHRSARDEIECQRSGCKDQRTVFGIMPRYEGIEHGEDNENGLYYLRPKGGRRNLGWWNQWPVCHLIFCEKCGKRCKKRIEAWYNPHFYTSGRLSSDNDEMEAVKLLCFSCHNKKMAYAKSIMACLDNEKLIRKLERTINEQRREQAHQDYRPATAVSC